MEKAVKLFNWYLIRYEEDAFEKVYGFMLSGIAEDHPKLGKGVEVVHTSSVEKFKIVDDHIEVKTYSRNYILYLKHFNPSKSFSDISMMEFPEDIKDIYRFIRYAKYIEDKDNSVEFSNDELEWFEEMNGLILQGKEELKEEEKKKEEYLLSRVKDVPNSLFIDLSSVSRGSTGAYNINGEMGIVKPYVHVGMFQDSVLYTVDGLVDFRYFPYPSFNVDAEVYNWSDGLDTVIIHNSKGSSLWFNKQVIKKDEEVVLDKSNYSCGLISPDVVNGNSILFPNEKKSKEEE